MGLIAGAGLRRRRRKEQALKWRLPKEIDDE